MWAREYIYFYSRFLSCTLMLSADRYKVCKVIKMYAKGEKVNTHVRWIASHREVPVVSGSGAEDCLQRRRGWGEETEKAPK